jgi:phosphohistidine phosphatase
MRQLSLLRHAKAAPAEQALADIARPLAERGERDARRIGERLRQHQLPPNLILASPSARTLRTAQLVATIF